MSSTAPSDAGSPRALDTRALSAPVDPAALRTYLQNLRASGSYPSGGTANMVGGIVGVAVVLLVMVPIFGTVVVGSISSGNGISPIFGLFFLFVIGAVAIGTGASIWSLATRRRRWFRIASFAAANGMQYWPQVPAPPEPGLIFQVGDARIASDLVRDPARSVDVADYRYTTGSGKERTTHRWGYLAIGLQNPLPNIVLDATSNNTLFGSNLPETFDRHQVLHLEGDFDKHFTLYCPAGYEQDALYLFTPDIMARFIDQAATLDVEIVDDRLFLYAQRDLSTLDAATWAWLFSIVDALESKFAQWSRWRDDRLAAAATTVPSGAAPSGEGGPVAGVAAPTTTPVELLRPPPGVAPQGRRLRRGVSWASIVLFVVIALFWIVPNILGHLNP